MSARRRPTAFVDTITAGGKVPEFAHAKPKGKAGMKGARTVAELRAAVDTAEKRRAADMKEIRGELKAIRGLLELRTPNELRAGLAVVGSAGPEIVFLAHPYGAADPPPSRAPWAPRSKGRADLSTHVVLSQGVTHDRRLEADEQRLREGNRSRADRHGARVCGG